MAEVICSLAFWLSVLYPCSVFCGGIIDFNYHFGFLMNINFSLFVVLNAVVDEEFSLLYCDHGNVFFLIGNKGICGVFICFGFGHVEII